MIEMYKLSSQRPSGIERMSSDHPDEPNQESKPLRQKPEPPLRAPVSDSNLTAAQRTVRELYQVPANDSARTMRSSFDSSDLNAIRQGTDAPDGNAADSHATVKNLLTNSSLGLQDFSRYEIDRGFASGGKAHYMLGAEFAIVAIIAMAGIAKRRTDLSESETWTIDEERKTQLENSEVIYQSPRLTAGTLDYRHGLNQDVPDWLVSLDGSAAKEEGYLFGSVLTRPSVLMTMSDTFVSLAEMHFRDAVLAWLIVDLNSKKVTETWKGNTKLVAICNGEMIELPVWEDIVEFYQSKPKKARADNLLTVVLKRNIDREHIEAELAAFVIPGSE